MSCQLCWIPNLWQILYMYSWPFIFPPSFQQPKAFSKLSSVGSNFCIRIALEFRHFSRVAYNTVMVVAVFSWPCGDKMQLFVLCTVIIGCVGEANSKWNFTWPSTHAYTLIGELGILSISPIWELGNIKRFDTVFPSGFKCSSEKRKTLLSSFYLSKSFAAAVLVLILLFVSVSTQHKNVSVHWSGIYFPQDGRLTPPLSEP